MGGQPINQTESRVLFGHEDYVFCVAFAADGQYLASSGDEHRILLWDLRHGASNTAKKHDSYQAKMLWSKENEEHESKRGERDDGREKPCAELRDERSPPLEVRGLVFAPNDNGTLISVPSAGTICVWKRVTQTGEWQFKVSFARGSTSKIYFRVTILHAGAIDTTTVLEPVRRAPA